MKIRLVTAIWGADFVNMFLRVGLRSLLAEGNLPDLARTHQVIYTIYTTEAEARLIEAAPAFQKLRDTVDVRLSLFALSEINKDHAGSHGDLWVRALHLAKRNREVLFLIIPDLIYAIGTLLRWARRFEEGYAAIYTPGPFICLETALPELEREYSGDRLSIAIPPDKIIDLILRHLHPLEAAMLRDAPRRALHPEHDIRPVKGYGFVVRVYTSQPFCIDPMRFYRIRQFSPEDHLDAICLEPCTTASVEPVLKSAGWYYHAYPLNKSHISQLGGWWDTFNPAGCLKESLYTYDFTLCEDATWRAQRANHIVGGRMLRAQVRAASVIYALWHKLAELGYFWSSAVLATAHYAADLRRHLLLRSSAVFLVPTDDVFLTKAADALWPLLAPGRESDLLRLIKEHVFIPTPVIDGSTSWQTANGRVFRSFAENVNLIGAPFYIEGHTVYMIDRLLLPDAPPATEATTSFPEVNYYRELGSEQNINSQVAIATSTAGDGDFGHPQAAATQSTFIRPRGICRRILQPCIPPTCKLLRRAHRLFHLVPIIGSRLARGSLRTAEILELEGWRGIELRIKWRLKRLRVRHLAQGASLRISRRLLSLLRPALHRLYYWLGRVPVIGPPLLSKILRVAEIFKLEGWRGIERRLVRRIKSFVRATANLPREVQRQGLRTVSWRIYIWVLSVAAALTGRTRKARIKVSAQNFERLGKIRQVRALQAAREILDHYQATTLAPAKPSAPLLWIDTLLQRFEDGQGTLGDALQRRLRQLLRRHPTWSEAWLELGYLQLEDGDKLSALQSFTRAAHGHQLCDIDPANRHPKLNAYAALARLQVACGAPDEADRAYLHALIYDHNDSVTNLDYGRFLWSRGEGQKAARRFFYGMVYNQASWPLPKFPRNAQIVGFDVLTHDG